jgi:hypothetical protein
MHMRFTSETAYDPGGIAIGVTPKRFTGGLRLLVSDINPQREIYYNISRWECFRIGLHLIKRAILA